MRILLMLLGSLWLRAQAQTVLLLTDLSAFRGPANGWRIVGGVMGSPTANALTSRPGTGVLLDATGKTPRQTPDNLLMAQDHGDVHLELDFMLPKGSNSGVYLMGRYEVQLYDSWGAKHLKYLDCGAIYRRWDASRGQGREGFEGFPPRQNACRAPGLWQHLAVDFEAPKFDPTGKKIRNAHFVKVTLNGTVMHENIEVSGPTRSAAFTDEAPRGPLMLQGDHGPVAFCNLRIERFDKGPLSTGPVSYAFYDGLAEPMPGTFTKTPDHQGTADAINMKLARNNPYVAKFDGTFTADETGQYTFVLQHSELGTLVVDGDTLISRRWGEGRPIPVTTNLTGGSHRYTLITRQGQTRQQPTLGLFVQRPGSYRQPLHAAESVPQPVLVPMIAVQPGGEVELVRAFAYKPGFSRGDGNKKLRVLHIGDPSGVHYSYDLEQGALLDVWKGDFLNMTDAWHRRGETQTAKPLGAVLPLWGTTPITTSAQNLPDSTAGVIFRGYRLDELGHPTFRFDLGNLVLTDHLLPYDEGRGLTREVDVTGGDATLRLARGKAIEPLGNGLYLVDGQFYVQTAPRAAATIASAGERQELLLPHPANAGAVRYELIW